MTWNIRIIVKKNDYEIKCMRECLLNGEKLLIYKGMAYGIAHAKELGHPIVYRSIGYNWNK